MADVSADARVVSVFCTVPDQECAERLATALLEERLAACVNILPGVVSHYRWQGALQRDAELVLLAKTRAELGRRVCERLAELHPHEVPCAVVLGVTDGLPAYLDWVRAETRGERD